MNVYIAKWLSLPALRTAHAYDYGPAHRQTGSRKQEQEAKKSTRHSRSRRRDEQDGRTHRQTDTQTDRQTGGWMDGWMDGSAPLYLCRLFQRCRRDAVKKRKNLIRQKKKKKLQIRICTKIWKLFCFFLIFNPPQCSSSSKWKTMKKVLIFVTSWISLCRHINFSTIR